MSVTLLDLESTGAALGGTLTATANNGVATFSGATVDQAGLYELYLTAANVGGANTNLISIVARSTPTTTTITTAAGSSTYGSPVTFTAAVAHSGSGTPTGTVTFRDNGSVLGTGILNSSDIATFTTSAPRGRHVYDHRFLRR